MIERAVRLLLAALLLALGANPAFAQAKLALVVGNARYSDAVGPLVNPVRDAELVARSLKARGFDVVVVQDAGRIALLSAVDAHVRKVAAAGRGAISFFYYSGHGSANPDDNRNYLIPVDATTASDKTLWYESIPLQEIVNRIGQSVAGVVNVVVFDACRDALKLPGGGKSLGDGAKGLIREEARESTLIAFSTSPGATAADRDPGADTGPFATELAKHLDLNRTDLKNMFDDVKFAVLDRTGRKQLPWVEDGTTSRIYLPGAAPAAAVASPADASGSSVAPAPTASTIADGGPARWGLANRDLSLMGAQDLLTKARFAARGGEVRAAADAGDAHAALLVAMAAQLGVGGNVDYAVAARMYRAAADRGIARGELNLGLLQLDGRGTARDPAAASALIKAAADAGNALAMSHLGNTYRTGAAGAVDPTAAVRWTSRAADAGEPYAMNWLGTFYRDGFGVAKDPAAALRWFNAAAEARLPAAMVSLGAMYMGGHGVPADPAKALGWYRKAADAGDAYAKDYVAKVDAAR